MKRLLILFAMGAGLVMLHRRIIDFIWEVTHDRYYLLWRLSPRWVKRLWVRDTGSTSATDISDDDSMTVDEFRNLLGKGGGDEP